MRRVSIDSISAAPGDRRWFRLFTLIVFALSALFLLGDKVSYASLETPELTEQEPHRSTVFVIDVSTSMYDIVDDLRYALKEYISDSQPGHSISIVVFGTTSRLLYRKTIRSDADIEKLLRFSDELSCIDEYTYIPSGLNAGVAELFDFYRKYPTGIHDLVLMSDGLNNPPKGLAEDSKISYADIREGYFPSFVPGKDWYISYIALKGIPDVELKDFVEECRGNTIVLERAGRSGLTLAEFREMRRKQFMISEAEIHPGPSIYVNGDNTLHLGRAVMPIHLKIPLLIRPRRGNPQGKRVKIEPVLTNMTAGTRLIVDVRPEEIQCGSALKTAEIMLSIDGVWDDAIAGALLFRPLDKSIFIVHPTQFQFQFKLSPKFLVGRYNPALNQGEYDPIDWLALGPLEPGGESRGKLALGVKGDFTRGEADISAFPDLNLPAGVTCTADVFFDGLRQGEAYVEVVAKAEAGASIRDGDEYNGNLVLTSLSRSVPEKIVPLKVFAPPVKSEGSFGARQSLYDKVKYNWKLLGLGIAAPTLILSMLAVLRLLRSRSYSRKFVPTEGWLVVLENPLDAEFQNTDLKELSETLKESELIIGSDASCQITLPHNSVDKKHAKIYTSREGSPAPVYIAPMKLSEVYINNMEIDQETKLQDRDIINIGAFQFLYSNSHLKQIVVHYRDGDVKYGVPQTWNVEDDGFVLRPEGDASDAPPAFIPFRDIKGVFFVKDFDKEIARKIKSSGILARKHHIVVKFKDGEKIEGYTMHDYDEKVPRFLMVPKEESGKEENNICILVERTATKSVKVLQKRA